MTGGKGRLKESLEGTFGKARSLRRKGDLDRGSGLDAFFTSLHFYSLSLYTVSIVEIEISEEVY